MERGDPILSVGPSHKRDDEADTVSSDSLLEERIQRALPADIRILALTPDITVALQAKPFQVTHSFPPSLNKPGGTLAEAWLHTLRKAEAQAKEAKKVWSTWDGLQHMRHLLESAGIHQTPTFSHSRRLDVLNEPFVHIPTRPPPLSVEMPEEPSPRPRIVALLIGIHYVEGSALPSTRHAVEQIQEYLFEKDPHAQVTVLMDVMSDEPEAVENGTKNSMNHNSSSSVPQLHQHHHHQDANYEPPTRNNILAHCQTISQGVYRPGDWILVYYGGHVGRPLESSVTGPKEANARARQHLEMLPSNAPLAGTITRDELLSALLLHLPSQVSLTCIWDICHGGSLFDMPHLVTTALLGDQTRGFREENKVDILDAIEVLTSAAALAVATATFQSSSIMDRGGEASAGGVHDSMQLVGRVELGAIGLSDPIGFGGNAARAVSDVQHTGHHSGGFVHDLVAGGHHAGGHDTSSGDCDCCP